MKRERGRREAGGTSPTSTSRRPGERTERESAWKPSGPGAARRGAWTKVWLTIIALAPTVLGGVWCGSGASQPIQFNHELHVKKVGAECADCHRFFKTERFSGIPDFPVCMECHEAAQTQSPEEEKIRGYASKGESIPWVQITDVPDHVFYSHRRHVVLGGLACETCHGAIAETSSPPARPLARITMDLCMDCHEKKGQSVDCIACHK